MLLAELGLFQGGGTSTKEHKEYSETGGWRGQRDGSRERGRGKVDGKETGTETSTGRGGRVQGSPDSRYLITDIASPFAPPPLPSRRRPLFLYRPEQMFAPRCRGQIAAWTNGRPVLQGTASCLPTVTPRIHTREHTLNTLRQSRTIPRGSQKKLSGGRESGWLFARKFASIAYTERFLRRCRLQGNAFSYTRQVKFIVLPARWLPRVA